MSSLKWRTVAELHLATPVVPNPDSTSELLETLYGARVAIEDGMVHIDPRKQAPGDRREEFTVTVVPTSAVKYIRYTEAPKSRTVVGY